MDIRRFLCKKPRIEHKNDVGECNQDKLPTVQTQAGSAEKKACKQETEAGQSSSDMDIDPEVPKSPSSPVCSTNDNLSSYDIGLFVQRSSADGINLIPGLQKKIWTPPDGYSFPASGPRNLKFQRSWLLTYSWLAYSEREDGAFCKCCVLFCARAGGVGRQTLGQLVTNPLRNWKKALDTFEKHNASEYHKRSLLQWSLRLEIEDENALSIDLQLSKQKLDFINESKLRMIPIIETIILCGRQGLALRGSRDTGRISEDEPLINDGNFRALLRFRAKNDEKLKKQLVESPKNAMYISNRVQNELINICHDLIMNHIVDRVNESMGFSFLGDDTPDIAGIEQSSICTRYLDKSDGKFIIREDFLCFITIADFTGKGIGTSYLNFLDSSGLNCTYFLGQGYDGARAVSGEFHGAQAVVRERYPLALYSHCAAHSFNLAVSSACNITAIRNCLGTLESIHTFFIYPKRQNALQDAINEDETLRESRLKKLKKFCKTRWVEQHESVATYLHLQPAVIRALDVISTTWKDPTTSSGAFQLLSAIKTANFQISMHILSSVHSLTLSLSRVLQSENQDLGEAIELADAAKQVLLERRENAEKDFREIFKTVSEISAKYDIELWKPRLASKQTQRSNYQLTVLRQYQHL
ncbi:zinc finger MYM-type protein 1-like [Diabrotica virgifera virgifera]|uniref:TTF-type domain-containing protein n=1 Tax=Diabrotica virgifera virgifera TaxID=50390 RepID=A0ABM5L284_DIAVI|nr:zinc finger MYM-type protein 1-like [Diabrotica virgifera virgifera]